MTNKPAMTIEEKASQLAGWLTNPKYMKAHFVDALTEAYARGRRDGLESAANMRVMLEIQSPEIGPFTRQDRVVDQYRDQIRALIEKTPEKEDAK